jgi:hypothetical protein
MSVPNPIKQAWQGYIGLGVSPPLADVRRDAARFDRHIRIRNRVEYSAGAIVIVIFSIGVFREPLPLVKLAHALIVIGTCFVMWQLHRRGSVPGAPTFASTAELMRHHREHLVRQRDALRTVWLWYLLPFVPGQLLFFFAHPALPGKEWVKAASIGFVVLIFTGGWWLNRVGARKLQRAIDRLDALQGGPE